MSNRKLACLRRMAKDYIVVSHDNRILGKVRYSGGRCYFRGHKESWMCHDTVHFINLLMWQLHKRLTAGEDVAEITSFEPGLHAYIKENRTLLPPSPDEVPTDD